MVFRQVVDGPGGRRYVVTANRCDTSTRPLARLLTGAPFLPTPGPDPGEEWEVRVSSHGGERVFSAGSGEVAERLMVQLGEEIELGLLEV